MTKSERKLRQQTKRQLVAAGVLPPPKKRLNRKKYVEQTLERYSDLAADTSYKSYVYLLKAIAIMATHHNQDNLNPSLEAIGAVKVLEVAAAVRKFEEDASARGETTYKVADLVDVINPIVYK